MSRLIIDNWSKPIIPIGSKKPKCNRRWPRYNTNWVTKDLSITERGRVIQRCWIKSTRGVCAGRVQGTCEEVRQYKTHLGRFPRLYGKIGLTVKEHKSRYLTKNGRRRRGEEILEWSRQVQEAMPCWPEPPNARQHRWKEREGRWGDRRGKAKARRRVEWKGPRIPPW